MKHLRALTRLGALLALGVVIFPVQFLIAGPIFKDSDKFSGLFWKGARKIAGINVEFNGVAIKRDRPMIYMSNHPSVLEPFILSSISRKSSFVAMKEIKDWPLFGRFAKSVKTVFASNGKSAGDLPEIHEQLTEALNAGRDITFCPEGKVGDGASIYPFKIGILSVGFNNLASQPLKVDIGYQPFALHLKSIDGQDPMTHPELRNIYTQEKGDERKLKVLWDVLCVKSVDAELTALEPLDPADYDDVHHLSDVARTSIFEQLKDKGFMLRSE